VLYDEILEVAQRQELTPSAKSFLLAILYRPADSKRGRSGPSPPASLVPRATDGSSKALMANRPPLPGSHEVRAQLVQLLSSHETRLVEQFRLWYVHAVPAQPRLHSHASARVPLPAASSALRCLFTLSPLAVSPSPNLRNGDTHLS
jgi:hypothetical protein